MQVKASLSAIFLCLVSGSVTANASDGVIIKPLTFICAGTAPTSSAESFNLACQVHGQNQTIGHLGQREHRNGSDIGLQRPRNSATPRCDVVEQGVCLE